MTSLSGLITHSVIVQKSFFFVAILKPQSDMRQGIDLNGKIQERFLGWRYTATDNLLNHYICLVFK